MTAAIKLINVQGQIKPLYDGTRVRIEPSTYTTVVSSFNRGTLLEVDQVLEYLENDPDRDHVRKGDMWGRLKDGTGWMAIMYHNSNYVTYQICEKKYTEVVTEIPTEPAGYPDAIYVYEADSAILENVEAILKENGVNYRKYIPVPES